MEYLGDIKIFLKVVQKKGFSAAAQDLQLSQSAVSKCVARLEQSLEVQLLNRSTHQLSLTEAGFDFHSRAIRIVEELEAARQSAAAVSAGLKGRLRVHSTFGVGHSFIAPAIAQFMEMYQDISIQLILATGDTVNIIEQDIDATIRLSTEREPLQNQKSFAHDVLGSMRYVICGTPGYFQRMGYPERPRDLESHNCLVHSLLPGANNWHFSGQDGDYVVPVAGNYSSNSGPALYEAVKRGIGLARMLAHVAREEIDAGRIESIFEDQTRSSYFLTAYYPRSERVPAKIQAFLNFLRQRLATLDAPTPAHD